jgi:tetratricopeptide (TPR) repeat protein
MRKKLILGLIINFIALSFLVAQDEEVAHEKNIKIIAFSPDSKLIITGGEDHMVKIWEAGTGYMQKSFRHNYPISKIFLSPDANLMISGNGNFFHCLWDLKTGKPLKCLVDQQVEGFTPDGKNIVVIGYGNDGRKYASIALINVSTLEKMEFPHKLYSEEPVNGLAFTSDNKNIIVSTGDKLLHVLDKNNPEKKIKHKLKSETSIIAISPDNKFFVQEGERHIYELKNYKPVLELEEATKPKGKSSLRFTPDGDFILSVYNNRNYDVFEADSGKLANRLVFNEAQTIGVSPNGKLVAYTTDGKNLILWDINRNEDIGSYTDKNLIEGRAFVNYLRGVYYYNSKRYPDAIKYFNAAIGKTARAEKIYLLRGDSYLHLDKPQLAIEDYKKDSAAYPGRASINLARAYAFMKDYEKAGNYLTTHINSSYMERFIELEGDTFFSAMRTDKKWEHIKSQYKKTDAEKLIERAESRSKMGDLLGAMEFINKAIQLEPTRSIWYKERASLNLMLRQNDNVVADYKRAGELDTLSLPEVFVLIANAYSKKGELDNAAFYLNKCIERDPSQFQFLLNVATYRYSKYRKKEALEAVNSYLEIIPDDPFAYYTRALVNDDNDQSRQDIQYAISLAKETGVAIPKEFMELKASFK